MSRAPLRAACLALAVMTVLPVSALSMQATPVTVQAQAETMIPAPLPNLDIEAPGPNQETLAAQGDPSLAPGIFNAKSHFAGDGYAPGSNLESDQNHRHTVGGGMNLLVPVP